MVISKRVILFLVFVLLFFACGQNQDSSEKIEPEKNIEALKDVEKKQSINRKKEYANLPKNITWLTNNKDSLFSSSEAKKGG
ncbi:MAG: hypothetical protein K8R67_04050, partial [Desulfobacteraceae bacterium]|nr:hypothetical protein [Desulfobacteraceae bacterium]